jgi:hypothetical protein
MSTEKCRNVSCLIITGLVIIFVFSFITSATRCAILADNGRTCLEAIDSDTGLPYLTKYGTFLVRLVGSDMATNITTLCGPVVSCAGSPDRLCDMPLSTNPIYYCDDGIISARYPVYLWQLIIWLTCGTLIMVTLGACLCTR